MPKKSYAVCMRCRYDSYGVLCLSTECACCPNYLKDPVTDARGRMIYCKCWTVEDGEECPYYEEEV